MMMQRAVICRELGIRVFSEVACEKGAVSGDSEQTSDFWRENEASVTCARCEENRPRDRVRVFLVFCARCGVCEV